MRDFTYDVKAIEEGKTEVTKLEADKKKQYVSFLTVLLFLMLLCVCMWGLLLLGISLLLPNKYWLIYLLSIVG